MTAAVTGGTSAQGGSWLLAQVVVEQLRQGGVRHVVLAPGSRNAPLSIALERATRDHDDLQLHVRIDERSAGFLALGMAKASGSPVAVVTTSGTAVANLAPAVMEANLSGLPLLVLSADRPVSMVNSGANQTADQAGLFGAQARASVRLSSTSGSVAAWRFQLRHALALATGVRNRHPGPVQVNLAFAEPLMPTDQLLDEPDDWTLAPARPAETVVLPAGPRTVVLAGDASPTLGARARAVAEAGRVPLLAEPSSNARGGECAVGAYRLLLGKPGLGDAIQRVVVFGRPTLSRPVSALLRRDDVQVVVVSDRASWADQGFHASLVCDDVTLEPDDEHWRNQWLTGDLTLQTKIAMAGPADADQPTGPRIAALLAERTAGAVVVHGSSNPIRDADLAPVPDACALGGLVTRTFANRGLAGIDGTISTAAGIALALDEPVTCLLGDLTFLHDVGGLWLGSLEAAPRLRLVVPDDRGGSIFHTLEQGGPEHEASFERVFGTPHATDLAAVAAGYGWQVATVTSMDELGMRLRVPVRGPELLVVPVERTDRRAWAQKLATL